MSLFTLVIQLDLDQSKKLTKVRKNVLIFADFCALINCRAYTLINRGSRLKSTYVP